MKKIVVFLTLILLLTGCKSKNESLTGKWFYYSNNELNKEIYYIFNEDNTGSFSYNEITNNFTYKLEDKKIIITYDNNNYEYEYRIDENILNINDVFGDNTTYKK